MVSDPMVFKSGCFWKSGEKWTGSGKKKQTNKKTTTVVARNVERKHHLNRITKEVLLSGVGRISLE